MANRKKRHSRSSSERKKTLEPSLGLEETGVRVRKKRLPSRDDSDSSLDAVSGLFADVYRPPLDSGQLSESEPPLEKASSDVSEKKRIHRHWLFVLMGSLAGLCVGLFWAEKNHHVNPIIAGADKLLDNDSSYPKIKENFHDYTGDAVVAKPLKVPRETNRVLNVNEASSDSSRLRKEERHDASGSEGLANTVKPKRRALRFRRKTAIEDVFVKDRLSGLGVKFVLRNLSNKKNQGFVYAIAKIRSPSGEIRYLTSPKEVDTNGKGQGKWPSKGVSYEINTLVYKKLRFPKLKGDILGLRVIARANDGSQTTMTMSPH